MASFGAGLAYTLVVGLRHCSIKQIEEVAISKRIYEAQNKLRVDRTHTAAGVTVKIHLADKIFSRFGECTTSWTANRKQIKSDS
jgi:hypothetical protein